MSLLLYKLSHLCMRHRRIVVGTWAGLIVVMVALVASVGAQTSDDLTLPGTGSTEATDLLAATCPRRRTGPTRSSSRSRAAS